MFSIKGSFNVIAVIGKGSFLKVTQEKSTGWLKCSLCQKRGAPACPVINLCYPSSNLQWSLAKAMKSSLLIRTEQLKMTENGNKERFQQQHFPFVTEVPFIFLALFFCPMEYLGFRGLVFEDTTSAYVDGVARITL